MTDDRKVPPHDAWDALERMSLDDEAARVGGVSDDALDRELASKGIDPKALRARGEALAATLAATAPARPVKLRPMEGSARTGTRLSALLAAAAIAAAGIVVLAMSGPAIVAMIRHKVIGTDVALPTRELPPEERAAQLRDDAYKECESERWETCEDLLNEARKLNSAGESDPRVKQWRWMMRPEQHRDGAPPQLDSK